MIRHGICVIRLSCTVLDVLSLNNSGFGDYLHLIYSKILWSSLWTGRQLQNIHISNDNGSFFLLHRIFSFLYQLQDFYETWIHTKTYVQMYMVSRQVFNIRSRNFLPYENTYVHPEYIPYVHPIFWYWSRTNYRHDMFFLFLSDYFYVVQYTPSSAS